MENEFIELVNLHRGILHKICRVYFYRSPYQEDYYQEMLIRLWKAYPGFRGQSAFSTWMYRVALNTAIDMVRKQSVEPFCVELSGDEVNIPDANPEEPEEKERLYGAIGRLSEVEKAVILLYLEEYDYKEIAAIVGISESYVGVKINRIKNQLIQLLGHGKR